MSRINGSAGWSRWKLLWVAALACPVTACKSTGPVGPSEPAKGSTECLAKLLRPQPSMTYTLACDGFSPKAFRAHADARVTFMSECEQEVVLSFSNPSTLFKSGVPSIVLKGKGDQTVEIVSDQEGCHEMCFGSPTCPPSDDLNSKTGSLDVITSGGPEPESKKPASP